MQTPTSIGCKPQQVLEEILIMVLYGLTQQVLEQYMAYFRGSLTPRQVPNTPYSTLFMNDLNRIEYLGRVTIQLYSSELVHLNRIE